MVEVLCQYKSLNGVMATEFVGLATTSREIREMIWKDAEKNFGKDVVVQNVGNDKYELFVGDRKILWEWYITRSMS